MVPGVCALFIPYALLIRQVCNKWTFKKHFQKLMELVLEIYHFLIHEMVNGAQKAKLTSLQKLIHSKFESLCFPSL